MIDRNISHYKILEKLGESGMFSFSKNCDELIPTVGGVIYKAGNITLKRIVVLG